MSNQKIRSDSFGIRLGRKYIGIDLDDNYTQITEKKLSETTPTKINGCFVSMFIGKIYGRKIEKNFKK